MSKHFLHVLLSSVFILVASAVCKAAPTISDCPSNFNVTLTSSCTRTINWNEPTATDPNGPVIIEKTHTPNATLFSLGTTTVTYTFTNSLDEVSTCSFDITVKYQFFNLPSDQIKTVDEFCNRTVSWVAPSNCSGNVTIAYSTSPTVDLQNGDSFPIGVTEVTYVALRGASLDDIESFTVTVNDNIAPTFDVTPDDITVAANTNCEATVNWAVPTVIDNCTDNITPTGDFDPGDTFPLGTTLVTYSASDEAGNPATYSFNVTVEDQTGPVYDNLPSNRTVPAATGDCKAVVSWPTVTATDNCTNDVDVNIGQSHSSGDLFDLGETEVTYTATDSEGNETIESFIITVVDATAPTLSNCPSDINLTTTNSCTAVATWSDPSFNDICDASPIITKSHNSGTSFPIGTTSVTITATDDAGNQTTCSFNVTVTDISAPVFNSCPSNITVAITGDGCDATATWTVPTASDNCSSDIVPTADFSPGDAFPLGTTTVTYTATDVGGNESTCSFDVTVVDQTVPVFTDCPADIEIAADATCGAAVSWTPPTATDNCDSGLTITESHASGSIFDLGTTTVTYTVTDEAGNETICTFNVTVIDETGPEITNCPSDIEITTAECEAVVNWDELTAVDNCSSITLSSNFSPGDTFALGTTMVSYTFSDELGNESECSFNVTVVNPDALQLLNCPEDITVETDDSGSAEVSWIEPTVESLCTNFTTSQSHQPGDTFQEGTTIVTYEFIDEFEAVVTCSFNVTVSIRDIEFDIPKLLTPNNDGNNDIWLLEGIENFPDNEVVVVDRWGSEIFKATGYDNQRVVWDGTNQNGKIVPTGTYFYYISVKTNSSNQKKQGFIEIIQ
ncbi:HYR domain-containing protein [Fulvivirga lutimaris]|uniref:HYR domain-containing protein n=1 Tax=Fulvivirga lutimaris TaxID=1819566 RepID=UPI0012BD303D|nr:HYR domain-containing protein [Fulvivirga lutimaris]MTI40605.1 HYR domain-containing protein [Fulvivirga lutimaris]